MQKKRTVDEYIGKHEQWKNELLALRRLILSTPLQETVKWGGPVYTADGKNIVGMGAFKEFVSLWFFQGALLKDAHRKLVSAQASTKALRQWRFTSLVEIEQQADLIVLYLEEALANHEKGKEIKPDRDKPLDVPPELQAALARDRALQEKFEALSKMRKREYADYIAEAKREATKQKRLEKIIPMILDGVGLHDKYRK